MRVQKGSTVALSKAVTDSIDEAKGAKMCTAATNRGHRGDPWRGSEAGAAGNSKAEDEPRAAAAAQMSLAAGVTYDD